MERSLQEESNALTAEATRLFGLALNEGDLDMADDLQAQHALVAKQHDAMVRLQRLGHC